MRIEETKLYYVICLISHYKLQIQAKTQTPYPIYHIASPCCNYIAYANAIVYICK